jgi:hypothetical protein
MITFYYLKEHSSFFLFSHLDSLHWLDKIYKDVRTMEYHFGSSNWSDTEVINSRIKKRILTSKFSFLIYIYYFTSHRQDKVCFVSCQKFVFIYKLLTYQPTTCVRACDNLSSNFFFFYVTVVEGGFLSFYTSQIITVCMFNAIFFSTI